MKQVVDKVSINGVTLYGKTGTSEKNNISWFVGFYKKESEKIYFAINLLPEENVSGKQAEKIAKDIISDCF